MPITSQSLQHSAEHAASTLPPLLIDANRVAATVSMGSHGRRRAGPGDTFWQFRHYEQGDSSQLVDWRQSAKFGALFVREREWDAAQTAALWCDCSPSMAFRSAKNLPAKGERASVLGLSLASLMLGGGERVRLLGTPQSAAAGRLALLQMAHHLERTLNANQTADLPQAPESLPRHSAVVLISDFLMPLPEIEAAIASFAGRDARGHLLQVLDPAEENLPYAGRIRFQGLEEEGQLLIERTEDIRDEYQQKLAAHRDALVAITNRFGWTFGVHHTDRPPHTALVSLHTRLSEPPR
ncbi:MAG: DUF58 domain-containing protein [Rhodospirillaceae bacterium]